MHRAVDRNRVSSDHRLFVSTLETDAFVYFSLRFICSRICQFVQSAWPFPDPPPFTIHSFYEYVQSSKWNTRDRKKTFTIRAVAYVEFSKGGGGGGGLGNLRIMKTKKKVFTVIQPVFLPRCRWRPKKKGLPSDSVRVSAQFPKGGHESILYYS